MSAATATQGSVVVATAPLAEPTQIRAARVDDLPALHDLAMRSKAYWGYDAAFMEACRDELRLNEEDLATSEVAVIDGAHGAPIGMAQVIMDDGQAELHKLFICPDTMGQGLGRRLIAWAVEHARHQGARQMEIESDPDAAPFYERMGAKPAGSAPSGSIPGRVLPRFLLPL